MRYISKEEHRRFLPVFSRLFCFSKNNRIMMAAATPAVSLDLDDEAASMEVEQEASLPKAGLTRLAKDAGGRLSPGDHKRVQQELFRFLSTVLRHTQRALLFTKRKSVARGHVEFAIGASGRSKLAKIAKTLKDKDLDRLHRCNIYASPAVRRAPIGAVEISEATFARILRSLAKAEGLNSRFSSRARRLLHLCSENFIVDFVGSSSSSGKSMTVVNSSAQKQDEDNTPSELKLIIPPHFVVRALADAFGLPSSSSTALRLGQLFETVASRLDPLLEAKSTKTVSEQLLSVALAETDSAIIIEGEGELPSIHGVKVVENLLRGRAPDRWVTHGAIQLLAKVLAHVAALDEREKTIIDAR